MYTITFITAHGKEKCYPYITSIKTCTFENTFLECKTNSNRTFIIPKNSVINIIHDLPSL